MPLSIRASIQLAAEQDSSVPMAKRMDFKTAFRTAYKDLHLAVDEIQDERPGRGSNDIPTQERRAGKESTNSALLCAGGGGLNYSLAARTAVNP